MELFLFVRTKIDGYNNFTYVHWLLLFKRIGFVAFFAVEKKITLTPWRPISSIYYLRIPALDKNKMIKGFRKMNFYEPSQFSYI